MKKPGFNRPVIMISLITILLAAAVYLSGCSGTDDGELKPNQPPRVWLSSAPPEGSIEKYSVQMYWGGWDPDGEIAYYEYAITDNETGTFDPADTTGADNWRRVYGNDSIFMFTADKLAVNNPTSLVAEFRRSHTFFIRAVDREGLATPQPVYRSFTSRTLSPRVNVSIPPSRGSSPTPAFVPPITTFRWSAQDYVDDLTTIIEPDSVSWLLESVNLHNQSYDQTIKYIKSLPVDSPKWKEWGGWKWYRAPQDSGKFWTTPPLDFEPYVFAIRAKDEAGAITPVFDLAYNLRCIQVSERTTGPIFTVENEYLGAITTAICHEPVTIIDLPAGIPIVFSWLASADNYGGVVTGYRYGWDIEDLTNPDQWETDYTPFTATRAYSPARTFFFGTHVFTVEVVDNSGYCSRVEVKINIIQFTMENNLLVVDDFNEGTVVGWEDLIAPGMTPNDAQHDAFWSDVLSDVEGFNPVTDVIPVNTGGVVPLTDLAHYKSIIWSVNGNMDAREGRVFREYVRYRPQGSTGGGGRRQPNVLALFLEAGGHLMVTGNHPVSLMLGPADITYKYPMIISYEMDGNQTNPPNSATVATGMRSFAYQQMCLETLEFAFTSTSRRRTASQYCPITSIRIVPQGALRIHTMRGADPIDLAFPRLDLRPEAAAPGRWYAETKQGLDVEVYNPPYFFPWCPYATRPRSCFEPIYGLDCLDHNEPTYHAPVAFWTSAFADRIAEAPGAIGARSVLFGFPLVYFNPDQAKAVVDAVLFDEWQLPRR